MLSTTHEVVEKYAQAIFDLSEEENSLAKVKQDMYFILNILDKNEQLKDFLANPFCDKKVRKQVIVNIFKDSVEAISLNFILVIIEKKLEQLLPFIVKLFTKLVREKEGIVEVRITTARELPEDDYARIRERLSVTLKKPVELEKCVDKSIIGGIIVQVGDRLINGSVINKLKDFEQLVKRVNSEQKGAVDVG